MVEPKLQPLVEPFGYWIEQKGAEPVLLRKPAYIPEPSPLRSVTPVYAADHIERLTSALEELADFTDGTCHFVDADPLIENARAALSLIKEQGRG